MGPERHWAYACWLKVEAGINELIVNRRNELKQSVTVEMGGRTCQQLREDQG